MNKKILLIVVGLVILGGLGFYFYKPQVGNMKVVVSYTKGRPALAASIENGVKLAFDQVNNQVGNYKIVVDYRRDDNEAGQWQKDIEAQLATEAAADPDVVAYIGPNNSGAAQISIPILNKAGIVQITSRGTLPELTQPGFTPGQPGIFYPTGVRTFFRTIPTDSATPAAIWASDMGVKSVIIFDDSEAYGKGIAKLFEKEAVALGIKVVASNSINKNSKDPIGDLKLNNLKADLVFFGGVTPNASIPLLKSVRKLGMAPKFMGANGIFEQAFADQGGADAEGVFATAAASIPPEQQTGKMRKFYDDYVAAFGAEPDPSSIFSYEAAKVIIYAIEKAGVKDREKILNEIRNIKNFDGALGAWSFDANGDTTYNVISGAKVINGKFVFQEILPNTR